MSALAQPRLTRAGQPYPLHFWPTGQLMLHVHFQVPGLGDRDPGSGIQVQVRVRVPNLAPEPDNPYPKPEARDLRPESLPLPQYRIPHSKGNRGPDIDLRPAYFISEDLQTLLSGATKMTLRRFFSASFLASSNPTAIKAVAQPSASKQ